MGLGRGAEDLAFFVQRLGRQGRSDLLPALLRAYERRLTAMGEVDSLLTVDLAAAASELRTRLLFWPLYLWDAPADVMAALLDRIAVLAARFDL